MNGWTLDLETTTLAPEKGAPDAHRRERSTSRRAFFDDGDNDPVVTDKRRDSLTLPSNVSRRSKTGGRSSVLVMEELDEEASGGPAVDDSAVIEPKSKKSSKQVDRQVVDVSDRSGHGKSEELGAPDTVAPVPGSSSSRASSDDTSRYILAIIHEFLQQRYPSHVVELFVKEMSVDVDLEAAETGSAGDAVDYNRLNHPGHTPKSQDALLAVVLGAPGSTPKASVSDLKALGLEDVDDASSAIPIENAQPAADSTDYTDSDISSFARRKRAANAHRKRVNIGEAGSTPKKEFLFFRETPPCFVAETIEAAEQALRESGGDPTVRLAPAPTSERFVELQSSDVGKYRVGQAVSNLGAQRNIAGLVSKLHCVLIHPINLTLQP
ncbi:hypothetical protein P43SY_011451 [Pythium insidiosum]|uniref:Uncharacterized protein n=1 Tax=Pythium insidiosum TaxID=114742 RepID=A0AAD5LE99_PYTIN|nr:hypothetical protein P43SY_011451 [Pythium insidiosum]